MPSGFRPGFVPARLDRKHDEEVSELLNQPNRMSVVLLSRVIASFGRSSSSSVSIPAVEMVDLQQVLDVPKPRLHHVDVRVYCCVGHCCLCPSLSMPCLIACFSGKVLLR